MNIQMHKRKNCHNRNVYFCFFFIVITVDGCLWMTTEKCVCVRVLLSDNDNDDDDARISIVLDCHVHKRFYRQEKKSPKLMYSNNSVCQISAPINK